MPNCLARFLFNLVIHFPFFLRLNWCDICFPICLLCLIIWHKSSCIHFQIILRAKLFGTFFVCFWIIFLPIFPLSFGILFPNCILDQLCASICPLLLLLLLQIALVFFLAIFGFLPSNFFHLSICEFLPNWAFFLFLSVIWSVFAILFQFVLSAMSLPGTLNIQTGRKLAGKSKDDILKAVLKFNPFMEFSAFQIAYDVIRVTFKKEEHYRLFKTNDGLHIFGMWCPILGGGPPTTLVHVFDYP